MDELVGAFLIILVFPLVLYPLILIPFCGAMILWFMVQDVVRYLRGR